jgi:hypothetical protein
VLCPNGVGGGPRGCRVVGLLDPVSFSLTEGSIRMSFGFREVSGGGDSGKMSFMFFVESGFGGASSESEDPQSSADAGAGGLGGNGGCRDEESGAVWTGVVKFLEFTKRPPGGPFFPLPPRPPPRPLFAPRVGSSSRGRLGNRGL